MKFSYNWIRDFVDGLDTPAEALERLITMKTAECEGIEDDGELLAEAVRGARRIGRADRRQPQREGRRGCRPLRRQDGGLRRAELPRGMVTVYVPLGKKIDPRRRERRHAGQRRRARHQSRSRGHPRTAAGGATLPAAPDSIIEIDNKIASRTGRICGATTAWRAKWRRSRGKPLRDPVKLELLPRGPAPVQIEIEDLDLCPRYSALVFENVTVSRRRSGCSTG